MTTKQIGQLTEIQANGGGYWLTSAKPTMFPAFFKRKILAGAETMDDYREVTDAQKNITIAST